MLNIDYKYLAQTYPLVVERQPKRIYWLYLLVFGLEDLLKRFKESFDDFKFIASHTSQTLSLEHLLNTLLTPTVPITITDGYWLDDVYVYNLNEIFTIEENYIYHSTEAGTTNMNLYHSTEYDVDQVDFIINVATADSALIDKIHYYVSIYQPAGTTYEINII